MATTESAEPIRFEQALQDLETIVDALESGTLDLDEALARYEQGIKLVTRCRHLLEGAERRVGRLTGVDADGAPQVEPMPEVEDEPPGRS